MARLLGISERAVRLRIETGALAAVRDGRQWRITLADGADRGRRGSSGGSGGGSSGGSTAPVLEGGTASAGVTPAAIERAVLRTSAQYMGDLRTVLAEVGQVYAGQLAAQRETIAELRRRAEVAEAEREALRGELGRLRGADGTLAPPVVAAPAAAHGIAGPGPGWWGRLRAAFGGR